LKGWKSSNIWEQIYKSKFYSGRNLEQIEAGECFPLFGAESFVFKIYRTIILPVFLYGCETWSLTSREERRLRVSENRVLRRIFGPKKNEVTREWRKLHNVEFND
jgi:hypothetical protein